VELLKLALVERAELLGIEAPSNELIQEKLNEMLQAHDDKSLFSRPPPVGADPRESVRGSEVLRRLYWDATVSPHDKVSDGKRLAELASRHNPELLEPLRMIVANLAVGAQEQTDG
jgi:hypothetical protein